MKHGASKVYAAVRDPASVAPLLQTYGDRLVPITIDLTRRETIKAAAESAADVSLVINNAGVLRTVAALSEDND